MVKTIEWLNGDESVYVYNVRVREFIPLQLVFGLDC